MLERGAKLLPEKETLAQRELHSLRNNLLAAAGTAQSVRVAVESES